MKTINGLTKKQVIQCLEQYLIEDSPDYVCNHIDRFSLDICKADVIEFIVHWAKKIYGSKIEDNFCYGCFGSRFYEDNALTRKAFVTLLIDELKK